MTPRDTADAKEILAEVRAAEVAAGRVEPLHVFSELVVFLDETTAQATSRLARLDGLDEPASDAAVFAGLADDLADLLLDRQAAGLTGFQLRPGTLPHDLVRITRGLVPRLQARGAFRDAYGEGALRARLGLARPASRYAGAAR